MRSNGLYKYFSLSSLQSSENKNPAILIKIPAPINTNAIVAIKEPNANRNISGVSNAFTTSDDLP